MVTHAFWKEVPKPEPLRMTSPQALQDAERRIHKKSKDVAAEQPGHATEGMLTYRLQHVSWETRKTLAQKEKAEGW